MTRLMTWAVASTMKPKITTIGNSAGVILPCELAARLRLEKGDELFALETPDGIRLTTCDPTLACVARADRTRVRNHETCFAYRDHHRRVDLCRTSSIRHRAWISRTDKRSGPAQSQQDAKPTWLRWSRAARCTMLPDKFVAPRTAFLR